MILKYISKFTGNKTSLNDHYHSCKKRRDSRRNLFKPNHSHHIWFRVSHPYVFLRKGVLKIYSKFTGEHPCRSAISIKFQNNFIEIALRHGCSPVNLLSIFRTPFLKNAYGWLILSVRTFIASIFPDSGDLYFQ